MVASPARGQLNRENVIFLVPVRACEFFLASQIRPSHPTPAHSFSTFSTKEGKGVDCFPFYFSSLRKSRDLEPLKCYIYGWRKYPSASEMPLILTICVTP